MVSTQQGFPWSYNVNYKPNSIWDFLSALEEFLLHPTIKVNWPNCPSLKIEIHSFLSSCCFLLYLLCCRDPFVHLHHFVDHLLGGVVSRYHSRREYPYLPKPRQQCTSTKLITTQRRNSDKTKRRMIYEEKKNGEKKKKK